MSATRLTYYNPKLDPRLICEKMTPAMAKAAEDGTYDDGSVKQSGPLHPPSDVYPYNLVSSLCTDGRHRPALDIDCANDPFEADAIAGIVSDLTGGGTVDILESTHHYHFYVEDRDYSWDAYQRLLDDLVDAGVLEVGYVSASIARGQTLLRPPHIRKVTSAVQP